jgi:hypothetical protein
MLFQPSWDFYHLMPLRAPALVAFLLNVVGLAAVGVLGVQWIRRVRRPVWRRLIAVAAARSTSALRKASGQKASNDVARFRECGGRNQIL